MSNKIAQLNLFNRKATSNQHLINEKKRLIQLAVERYNNNKINYIHSHITPINKPLEINNPEVSNQSVISNENMKQNKSNNDITNSNKNIVNFKNCVIFHKKSNYL
jgi:hypothetical protein